MEFLTWSALIAAGTSLVAMVKFWIDIGRSQQRTESASEAGRLAQLKYDLLKDELNRHMVETAKTYATARELGDVEAQFARGLEQAMSGLYQRLDGLNARVDSLINIAKAGQH